MLVACVCNRSEYSWIGTQNIVQALCCLSACDFLPSFYLICSQSPEGNVDGVYFKIVCFKQELLTWNSCLHCIGWRLLYATVAVVV